MKKPTAALLPALLSVLLACMLAGSLRAADVPRLRITIPAGAAHQEAGGSIHFLGTATALVRVRGLAVLIDPGEDGGSGVLPQADVVLLSQPAALVAGLSPWSGTPVVTMAAMAQHLRAQGYRSVYPLETWEGITIRKGDTRLRLTSMPDARGMRPAAMAVMLDFGPSCRVFVHNGALTRDEIGLIPQRFPGARLALLRQDGTPLLLSMDGDREATARRPVARGEPYRFGSATCN
ncbi:hypothetical protein IP91_04580 [Pseudoduganella lurida]|uniref:Uncharacterized protein n=1 Tax=Pseudoduganella lurida TaxID=1036180 RepID=A0A562QZ74_9BURK|nr:hypothetical protein [Pseudoduganella lurida]TWI61500.1 hypothetical protein IP91_04580 [Pseudoduganella lurida]